MEALTVRLNWNLKVLAFVEGGKLEKPERNPWIKVKTNNKINPHVTASMGTEPGSQMATMPSTVPTILLH